MADFKVRVMKVKIEPHPDPETTALEVARIGDYMCVVGKGLHQTGNLTAYIPEASVLPAVLIEEMQLTGKLAGAQKNRVKAIRLRKVLSQGLVYGPAKPHWVEGLDVAEELGITKYEPPIPSALAGMVGSCNARFHFDVEDVKKYPEALQEGEEVIFTEKLHGTCTIIGLLPRSDRKEDMLGGKLFVSSKGKSMAQVGCYLKDCVENERNVYLRAAKKYNLAEKLSEVFGDGLTEPVWLVGETFGSVQKGYNYGLGAGEVDFRAIGIKHNGKYYDYDEFLSLCEQLRIKSVPILYRGPYSKELMLQYTNGKETVSNKQGHIREGIVVYPTHERSHPELGRVILKSVSPEYLLKTTGEEVN